MKLEEKANETFIAHDSVITKRVLDRNSVVRFRVLRRPLYYRHVRALLIASLVALPAAVSLPFCGDQIDRRPIEDVSSDSVTYQAEDGVHISASWFLPDGVANPPVVILLHERGGSRQQWNELIPTLVDKDYAVLAPDLRGHGKSDPYELTNSLDALLDVAAALRWLGSRNDVDQSRIAVIGARFGADLAYVSSGAFPQVRAAIAMTPSVYNAADPLLTAIRGFAAHDVFLMAGGKRQWEEAVTLGVRIRDPGGRRYIDHPDLDGVALLALDDAIRDILDWLQKRLVAPSATAPPPS